MKFTISILLGLVSGHSNLFKPDLRHGPSEYFGYCSAELIEPPKKICRGPCHTPKDMNTLNQRRNMLPTFSRSENIPVKWFRQNHPGGFVRLSIVPFDDSDKFEAFDQNAILTTCYERQCTEDSPHEFNATAKIGANHDGSPKNDCTTHLPVPGHLPDGAYTLQWLWYGGGFRYADQQDPFANYYSCSDIIIKGGPTTTSKPPHNFVGGDTWNGNPQQCRYWGKPDPHSCTEGANANCPKGPFKLGPPTEFAK